MYLRTSKRVVSLLVLSLSCGTPQPTTEAQEASDDWPEQPNILWLVAEDLGPYIPSFGDSTVVTPNLDRLAREGVRYTQVYSPSGVCAPSRFAIATGLYPNHGGGHHMRTGPWYHRWKDDEYLNANTSRPDNVPIYEAMPQTGIKLHSEYLRMAGYYCTNNSKQDYQFRAPVTAWDDSSPEAHWKNRKPGQPFFAIFNYGVTHESQIWRKAQDSLLVDPDLEVPIPPYLPQTKIGQQDVQRMYSNILEMDRQVGEMLDELEAAGELENTVIFWYTDHGGPLPRQKRMLYDSGINLPMIIRYPQKKNAGTIDSQLISFVDFKPTILSLAGIELPEYLDGRAFTGALVTSEPRQYVHAAADRFDGQYDMIRAVRDARYKYLRNYQPEKSHYLPVVYREQMPVMQELLRLRAKDSLDQYQELWFRESKQPEELYDCENDPHELHNLAGDSTYQDKLEELRAECDRWMEEINDLGLTPELKMLDNWWPHGKQPVTSSPRVSQTEQQLEISVETPGASIGYQRLTNGDSLPSNGVWQIYTGPLEVPDVGSIAVIAHRIGYQPSEIVVFEP